VVRRGSDSIQVPQGAHPAEVSASERAEATTLEEAGKEGMTRRKVEQYDLEIKDGLPPARVKTSYHKQLPDGRLEEIAAKIRHGQYVAKLSAGSAGKLVNFVKEQRHGLIALRRGGQTDNILTVYVVTEQWLSEHPEVRFAK
jgi:hypothetical protein